MRPSSRLAMLVLMILSSAWLELRAYTATEVLDRIVDNWRWSKYWFGKTGIDDVYVVNKRLSVLVFWTKTETRPIRGLCSNELALCVAYSGIYLDPLERRTEIAPDSPELDAFTSWVNSGLRDSAHLLGVTGLKLSDFNFEQRSITLPALIPPSAIINRATPREAPDEAKSLVPQLACWGGTTKSHPPGCSGDLVFAYYGPHDPYWFVLRSCSASCEFKGDAVEELARGDHSWDARASGFIAGPPEELERLKEQILRAEMFRIPMI